MLMLMECLMFCLFFTVGFCEDSNLDRIAKNPGLLLNMQDVPLFLDDHPLTGLKIFAVVPPYSLNGQEMQKKVNALVETEFASLGSVIKLKAGDVRGVGSGNMILIQMGKVKSWEDRELSITRFSLNVESGIVINKTGLKTFDMIWSINAFSEQGDKNLDPIKKLIKEFGHNYQFANLNQDQKPIFYIYE